MKMKAVFIAFCCLAAVYAHRSYRSHIPNGYSVPDPCLVGGVWSAVGHFSPTHDTRNKNKFGEVRVFFLYCFNTDDWNKTLNHCNERSHQDQLWLP